MEWTGKHLSRLGVTYHMQIKYNLQRLVNVLFQQWTKLNWEAPHTDRQMVAQLVWFTKYFFLDSIRYKWWNSLIKWNWLFTFSPFKILQRWFFKKVDKTKTTLLGWIHWSLFTEVVVMFLCLTWWFTDLLEYVLKNVKSIWNVYIYFQ